MTIGGVSLLLVLVPVLYYAYRVKQRSNRLLKAQRKEIDQKNQHLQQLVTEKEQLVKEIHHRVKNNLYIISSLLESQSAYLHDEALFEIQKSQHRVEAISALNGGCRLTRALQAGLHIHSGPGTTIEVVLVGVHQMSGVPG